MSSHLVGNRRALVALAMIVAAGLAGCAMPRSPTTRSVVIPTNAAPDRTYLAELTARARALDLARRPGWLRLGHYRPTAGGWRSEADGENFFLSPRGKGDPAEELDATLAGFFAAIPAGEKRPEIQHPACQFPARYQWLDQQLGFDAARLRVPPCERFAQFRDLLDAASVTLVFSSYYLNSPASAFGHTFLRINSRKTAVGEKRELLDYGIDYSADVDTSNAVLYAVKGLLGYFPGRFRRLPYYYKVREYGDYESRDLWEYQLAMSPVEVERLVAHLWELGSTYFDYFYTSENCSYHVLGALEAATSRDLLGQLHRPVVPADTVKAVQKSPGLVQGVAFRPSVRTQFERRIDDLSRRERNLVERLALAPEMPLPDDLAPARRIRVLDAAQDLVDIRFARELPFQPGGRGGRIKQRLGERRAEILLPSEALALSTPVDQQPHVGHRSRRLGAGAGIDDTGAPFAMLDLRVTMHDLADPGVGYPSLSQLEFLPGRLRIWLDRAPAREGEARRPPAELDELWLVRIMSLTPQSQFDRKLSWKAQVGASRIRDAGCGSCTAGTVIAGSGATFATRHGDLAAWFFLDGRGQWAPSLDGLGPTGFRLGGGPSGAVRARLGRRLTTLVGGEWIWLPAQEPLAAWSVDATLRWHVAGPVAVDVRGTVANETLESWSSLLLYY